jgi:hypothetical protein
MLKQKDKLLDYYFSSRDLTKVESLGMDLKDIKEVKLSRFGNRLDVEDLKEK